MSIVITDSELEKVLKNLLQKQAIFRLNGRAWRSGRIILFKQSGFYIEFIIKSEKKKQECFEVPIPFKTIPAYEKNPTIFSYKLVDLIAGKTDILPSIKKLPPAGRGKFYDILLEIETIPDVIKEVIIS